MVGGLYLNYRWKVPKFYGTKGGTIPPKILTLGWSTFNPNRLNSNELKKKKRGIEVPFSFFLLQIILDIFQFICIYYLTWLIKQYDNLKKMKLK